MRDYEWVREQLKRLTYRPEWSFAPLVPRSDLEPLSFEIRVQIKFEAEDTRNPGSKINIGAIHSVPYHILHSRDESLFMRWFQHIILETEVHESKEWLRLDGEIFDDPHK